jgi:glycosyltransferase involved in cell wall biosynthesis
VDINKFSPLSKVDCRKILGWDVENKYFLYPVISSINTIKRPSFIEKLRNELPPSHKIITAQGLDHNELSLYYSAADCVLLPSMYEGWPNVIKEALLCNTPFFATDVSDLREIAESTKSCKVLPLDTSVWLQSMEQFTSINENLRSKVLHMNLQALCGELLEYYSQLIDS